MLCSEGRTAKHCPLCETKAEQNVIVYNTYSMNRCTACSFLFTARRDFPLSQYETIYASDGAYVAMLEAAERTAAGTDGFHSLWWFKKLALRRLSKVSKPGRLLDVGCGPGTFLIVAQQRGWEVVGVEPATFAATKAQEFGLDVYNGLMQDFVRDLDDQFDALTCFEVLEHVPDPLALLQAFCASLRPGGNLILSVPNLDDPYCLKQQITSAMPPVHINFFNRKSLGHALEQSGFDLVRYTSLPIPTSSVRNCYGKSGFVLRVPLLVGMSLLGRADGTTLVAEARRSRSASWETRL